MPDVPSRTKTYNLLCKDIQKAKKELQGVPVSKASAIILKECKKVKASKKNFYEGEKKRHEEALQRCQEDHADEMEITKLLKKCNKKNRKVLQPKALSKKLSEPIDDPSEEE